MENQLSALAKGTEEAERIFGVEKLAVRIQEEQLSFFALNLGGKITESQGGLGWEES